MKFWRKHTGLLAIIIVVLLLGLPTFLFAVSKPTNLSSNANAATTLSFSPTSSTSSPIKATVGTGTTLDLYLTPNTNAVSFINLELLYDPAFFTANQSSFVLDTQSNLLVREGPVLSQGRIAVSLGIGSNYDLAIKQKTKIATITLNPIAKTSKRGTTSLRFGSNTYVLSIGSSDSPQENVISSTQPAIFTISSVSTGGGKGKPPR